MRKIKTAQIACAVMLATFMVALSYGSAVLSQQQIPSEQTFYFTKPETWVGVQLNPFGTMAQGIIPLTYERLGESDDVDILYHVADICPMLAQSWGWVDNVTFRINLYKIAHFRSGRPVTADDVVFSLQLEMRPDVPGPLAFMQSYVDSLSKIDDYTVQVKMKPQYASNKQVYWLLVDSYILPEYEWQPLITEYGYTGIASVVQNSAANFTWIDGSGPYTPISIPTSSIVYQRVDNYWGLALGWANMPKYLDLCGDASSDVMWGLIDSHQRDLNSESAEISVEWQRDRSSYLGAWNLYASDPSLVHGVECGCKGVDFNFQKDPIFLQPWLREALTYDVNYTKIAEDSMYSQALPANVLSLYATAYPDYVNMTYDILKANFPEVTISSGIPRLPDDPNEAISILKQYCDAGSSVTNGWTYKGQKIGPFKLNTVAGWSSWEVACEILAQDWSAIGIPVTVNPLDFSVFYTATKAGDFDLTYNWQGYGNIPISIENDLSQLYAYNNTMYGIEWAGDNPTGFGIFWNGSYAPLPNIAGQVRNLISTLWTTPTGTQQFVNTFKQIAQLVVPQLSWIPTAEDGAMKVWNHADRWTNWPTSDDPYPYRIFDTGVGDLIYECVRNVYPVKVESTALTLSNSTVESGKTVTATVTLKNTGSYAQNYKVAVNLGPAEPGWELTEPGLLGFKIVTAQPGTTTVTIPITINATGSYVIVVDNWRMGKEDPGTPLTAALSVTVPTPAKTVTVTSVSTSVVTTTTSVSVPTVDMTSVAGAGIVALIVGLAVGWLVASRRK